MSYKVLYRKYRPMRFEDVVGQPQVTVTLKNELTKGRISHAYLFTGCRGTGKTTCAKILSKAVNCLDLQDGDPCGVCESCTAIENGSVMDVVEMDAASNNGVDSIRSLIEEAAFTPSTARYRVYIIDEVHMLSDAAFNALLKTLEEPPAHVIFILATTEVHKLLATILSRCQRLDFKRINPAFIAERLTLVCEREGVQIHPEAAKLIARLSDGGMRDALSILDQCMGISQSITLEIAAQTTGTAGRDHLFDITDAIAQQNSGKALEILAELYNNSKDMNRLCEELSGHFRSLMLIKTKGENLLDEDPAELARLGAQSAPMTLAAIIHALDTFQRTLDKMRFANGRTELEMALIRLCSPELDSGLDALVRRIEALEQGRAVVQAQPTVGQRPEPPASKSPLPSNQESSVPQPSSQTHEPDELSVNAVRFTQWPEVVHRMMEFSKTIGMAFNTSNAYISGDYMLVQGSDLAFEYLRKNQSCKERLKESIFAVTGRNYRLGPYKGGAEKKEDDEDPIEALTKRAKDAGIEIIEK